MTVLFALVFGLSLRGIYALSSDCDKWREAALRWLDRRYNDRQWPFDNPASDQSKDG